MNKDWVGNKQSAFTCNGASNHSEGEREANDFYATEPKALELLLNLETFKKEVWECACGAGHLSKVLADNGKDVLSSDLFDRGYPGTQIIDFLKIGGGTPNTRDIITNPPYKYAREFAEHALDISADGTKVAMFLKLTFLESKARRELFRKYPPKTVWVSSSRLRCGKNGRFDWGQTAVAYAWYIWVKGYEGDTIVKWFN